MKMYTKDQLINSLNLKNGETSFLIGAGCSIESGCMAANKLVKEFKRRIYCSDKGIKYDDFATINDTEFECNVEKLLPETTGNDYAYYFEKCFPNSIDRNQFIKEKFQGIEPSLGYLCFANFLITKKISSILTTNFDNLIEKALRRIEKNIDLAVAIEGLNPILDADKNIVKLHGDYNYHGLKNTNEEIRTLSEEIQNYLKNNIPKRLIVLGYSGSDDSVMKILDYYSKNNVEIIWCTIDGTKNDKIDLLLANNVNSGYCLIDGFDDLFITWYSAYGTLNDEIEIIISTRNNENFELKISNQTEQFESNCFKIQSSFPIYKINGKVVLDNTTDDDQTSYFYEYGDYTYFFGDSMLIDKYSYKIIDLIQEELRVQSKCKIIKDFILYSVKKRGINVYKNNVFNGETLTQEIKEGLKINVELFQGEIHLITNVNYFTLKDDISDNLKFCINQKKSSLYSNKNYELMNKLIKELLGDLLEFSFFDSKINFCSIPFNLKSTIKSSGFYNCEEEPIMKSNNSKSVNHIKLMNEVGPNKALFSPQKIRIGVFSLSEDKNKLNQYLKRLKCGSNINASVNSIIPQFRGFENIFNVGIEIIDVLPKFSLVQVKKLSFDSFVDFCNRGIARLYKDNNVDIVLIYISDKLYNFRKFGDKDLHDLIKLNSINKFKTQFIEEASIDSRDDINKKLFNLSTGIYTKTVGIPWIPYSYSKDTLFIGMSFGKDSNGITVGCSQMFDGAGRGMKLIVSKVSDKRKKNQYLSYDEAYELGKKIRSTYYKTSKTNEIKRIVIHRMSHFTKDEISGFNKAFVGIDDFVLLQLSDFSKFNSYKSHNNQISGYPLRRGTTIKDSKSSAYVWTDGSINNLDIQNGKTYRNSKRGMGIPIKIIKHHGNISLNEAVIDLMNLTKMDFNSSDVIYSKLPVTIKYSQIVCDILKQGTLSAEELISFEYIM